MAVRGADAVLVLGAVDVNKAIAGIGVVLLHPIKPQDSGGDPVVSPRQRIPGPERHATLEDGAAGHVMPDFLSDLKLSQRRLHAPFFRPQPEARAGNRIGAKLPATLGDIQALILNRDFDRLRPALFWWRVLFL